MRKKSFYSISVEYPSGLQVSEITVEGYDLMLEQFREYCYDFPTFRVLALKVDSDYLEKNGCVHVVKYREAK